MTAAHNLILTDTQKVGRRVEYSYRDEVTGRQFNVAHYLEAAEGKSKDLDVLNLGKADTWTSSEMVPKGRLYHPKTKCFDDVEDSIWAKARLKPSDAFAAIKKLQDTLPGYVPIFWGGGRSCQTIYHPTQEAALHTIHIALDTDTWVINEEPIREATLFPRGFITLDAKATLEKAPGEEQISAALASIRSKLKKSERLRVSEHCGGLRLDVSDESLSYPDSCRLFLLFTLKGTCEPKGFARAGWYDLGDQLTGITIPRFDDPRYASRAGIPFFGQSILEVSPVPDGFICRGIKRSTEDGSDKIYAHIASGSQEFVIWGKSPKGKLRAKAVSYSEAADRFHGRGYEYKDFQWQGVPDFWERVVAACKEEA